MSEETRARDRLLAFLICAGLVCVPLAFVSLPVGVDVAQHVAQVRLLDAWLAGHHGSYELQWYAPYGLFYALVLPLWGALRPVPFSFAMQALLAVLWIGGVHFLAWKRDRKIAGAILGSVLFFNPSFYWAFLPFLFGMPIFFVWVALVVRPPQKPWLDGVGFFVLAWLLYFTHILWFLAALFVLGFHTLYARDWRSAVRRLLLASPPLAPTIFWYPTLAERGMDSSALYFHTPTERLGLISFSHNAFGGVLGSVEMVVTLVLLAWIAAGAIKADRAKIDSGLATVGVALLALYLLLPDVYHNTMLLSSRWLAPSLTIFLLALPLPPLPSRTRILAALGVVLAFVVATGLAHRQFEETDRAGLAAALEALPDEPRVIGLDYAKTSNVLRGRPNLQAFAFAQVLHGGELNFSFASFAPFPMVYQPDHVLPWTPGLEWYPEHVTLADLAHFDFLLLSADDATHERLAPIWPMDAVTTSGVFRLYRIRHTEDSKEP